MFPALFDHPCQLVPIKNTSEGHSFSKAPVVWKFWCMTCSSRCVFCHSQLSSCPIKANCPNMFPDLAWEHQNLHFGAGLFHKCSAERLKKPSSNIITLHKLTETFFLWNCSLRHLLYLLSPISKCLVCFCLIVLYWNGLFCSSEITEKGIICCVCSMHTKICGSVMLQH